MDEKDKTITISAAAARVLIAERLDFWFDVGDAKLLAETLVAELARLSSPNDTGGPTTGLSGFEDPRIAR